MKNYLARMRGNATRLPQRRMWKETAWACLLSFAGMMAIYWFNRLIDITESGNLYLIGSFGASAVLIYGAPSSDFSQPRSLIGGHFVSALIGMLMYKLFPDNLALAGALAVSLAIGGMFLTGTIHPPGGATALIAIINPNAHELGFSYLFAPVLSSALIMLATALLMNNLSSHPGRHYPRYWY